MLEETTYIDISIWRGYLFQYVYPQTSMRLPYYHQTVKNKSGGVPARDYIFKHVIYTFYCYPYQ